MVTYTLNNVYYTYTIGIADASVESSASATDDISLLSSFEVDGATYNVTSIAASAFYGATNLTSITIPTSVTVINESTFEGCTNLTTVNIPSVTSIGVNAFYGCSSLTSITIPATVTNILGNPFRNCTSLSSIIVDSDNTVFFSENGVLFDKLKQNLILYPSKLLNTSYVIPSTVESINSYAFSNCENLITVMIPSLTSLNDSTFHNCSNLLNVIFTGVVPTINGNNFEATPNTAVYDSAKNPNDVLDKLSIFTNTINQPTPTLTNFTLPSYTFSSVPLVITPPTSDVSGGVITYTSSNSAISTVSGDMLTLVTVDNGTSYITATQTITNFYGDLSFTTFTSVNSNALYVYQAIPSLLSFSIPEKTFGDVSFNLVAPTSDSDGAFTYTSSDTAVATIDGITVTIVAVGTSTITAVQASTANFSTESITASLVVSEATPILTDFSVPAKTFGDVSFNLVAPTTNSPGAFTYTSSDTTVATIEGNTVTILEAGTATITAVQESTANFLTESITATLVVSQATPVITDFSVPAKTFGDESFNLVAPTTNSPGDFTYTSSDTAVATIEDNTVTIIGAGIATITAVQESTANYSTGSITATLVVSPATSVLTDFSVLAKTFGDVSFNLVAPTTNSPGAFTYTSSDTAVATIDGSRVTIIGVGTSTITAVQASTTNYSTGSIPATLVVSQATPIITDFSVPAKTVGDAPFNLVAPTSNSSGLYTYTSSNTEVATIEGNVVTIVGNGISIITATQESTTNYLSSSITSIFIVRLTPIITDFSVPVKSVLDASFNLVAPTTNSDGLITYTSSDTTVATISGSTVTIVGGGTITITAVQSMTDNYASGTISATLVVTKLPTTISAFTISPRPVNGGRFYIGAPPPSNRDGFITLTSSNPSIATVTFQPNQGIWYVDPIAAGNITVTATQASTSRYEAGTTTANLMIYPVGNYTYDNVNYEYNIGLGTANVLSGTTESRLLSSLTVLESFEVDGTTYTVTGISQTAFNGWTALTSISLPPSIITMGPGCFASTGLTSFTFPPLVTVLEAGVFISSSLTSITIPSTVTTFKYLFDGRGGGSSNGAFVGCTKLVNIVVNTYITGFEYVFYRLNNPKMSVTFDYAGAVPPLSFHNITGLITVVIGNQITSIGNSAFQNTGLINVTLGSSLTTIENGAFYGCKSLKNITLPPSLTSIGNGSFAYCTSLNNIILPSSLTTILDGAFEKCTNFTSITLPPSLTNIANGIFLNCERLTNIIVKSYIGSLMYTFPSINALNMSVTFDYDGLIPGYVCMNMPNLKTVNIGNSITGIEIYAFSGCTGLTEIIFPASITTIQQNAFFNCTNLNSVSFLGNIPTIGWNNFTPITDTAYYRVNETTNTDPATVESSLSIFTNKILITSASPTITNFSIPMKKYNDTSFSIVDPSSNSTGAFSYTSSNPAVATVSGNVVTIGTSGSTTITATQSAGHRNGVDYTSGTTITTTFVVDNPPPKVGPLILSNKSLSDAPFMLVDPVKPANSTGTWTYTSSDVTKASISGKRVTLLSAGIVVITATITSDSNYCSTSITGRFTISALNVAPSTFVFVSASDVSNSIPPTVQPIENAVVLSPTIFTPQMTELFNPSVGTIAEKLENRTSLVNTLFDLYHNVNIVSVPPSAFYMPSAIDPSNITEVKVIKTTGTTSQSPLVIDSTSLDPTTTFYCPLDEPGNSVLFNGTHIFTGYTMKITKESDNNYTVTQTKLGVPRTFSAVKDDVIHYAGFKTVIGSIAGQLSTLQLVTLMYFGLPSKVLNSAPFAITRPTTTSNGLITYTSSDPSIATISGDMVTVVGLGTATITAFQAQTDTYLSDITTATFTVNKISTILSNFSVPAKTYGSAAFTITPPTTNSDGTFTYTSSNTAVATIVGNTITIVGIGTSTITAVNAASARYTSATINASFLVNKGTPALSNFSVPAKTFGDASFEITPPTTDSSGAFTYISSNTAVATIAGNVVTIVGIGSSTITASQAATALFLATTTTTSLVVNKATPIITNFSEITKTFGNAAFNLVAPTSNSDGSFTYTSSNAAVATIAGSTVTIVGGGTATITATQAATTNYSSGTITATMTVSQATPTITNFSVPEKVTADTPFTIVNPTSNSSGAFTYTSSNTSVATIAGNMVTIVGKGTSTITASQASTTNYLSGSITATLIVRPTPVITNFAAITKTFGDAAFSIVAPTTDSDGTFTYTSSNTAVATVSGTTITIVGAGTSTITANQSNTANYGSGMITTSLTVNKATPTITIFSEITKTFGNADFNIVAPTSNSDGSFTYTSSNTAVATIAGSTVTIVGGGTATITATQAATTNYLAGTITTTITVSQATPLITVFDVPAKSVVTAPFRLVAPTSNSSGAFTYTSSNTSVATVDGSMVTIVGLGNTTITAVQASTTNYLSGSITGILAIMVNVPLSIAVGSGGNSIATSIDRGLTWTGCGTSVFTSSGSCVAFGKDGSGNNLLVAVGSGGNTIATSTNGSTWIGLGATVFTSQGLSVTYANNLWVAVGEGTNTIATSTDGVNWTGRGTSIFSNKGTGVAFNNGVWVAVGDDGTNSIATSTDGVNWTGLGKTSLSGLGRGIAYGNGLWVAVGEGTNSIATSTDGVNWTGRTGTSIFSNQGIGVAFNNGLWIAVGQGTTNTIATSTNGVAWTGRGKTTFSVLGQSISYNSGLWIAVGQGTNSIATSPDGVAWTGRGTSVFSTSGFGVAVGIITPPNITGISPSSGALVGGTSVTITGTNFTGATSVTFGGLRATSFNVLNSTTITCIAPARSAGAVGIIVTTEDGPSGEYSSYTYVTPPTITGISIPSGSTEGGTIVTITGTSFMGATSVTFGGLAATSLSIVNNTTITCITPARSIGAVGIIVTTLYGTSSAFSSFTYITPPVISSISPLSGSTLEGTSVTIRGTSFTGATSLTFGGISATSFSIVNSTTITCITPVRTIGAVDVIVTTGGGPSVAFSSFTYITPPTITDISPLTGSTLGGTNVTITGTNFTGATMVTFGGIAATTVNVVNSTTINCVTRDRSAGAVGVIVTTGGGPSGVFSDFTYITPPVISSISPLTGSTMGGTTLTITGTSFTGATLVSFSGIPATSLNVVNSTTITCVTPIRTNGAAGVVVKTIYGTSVAFLSYTYIIPPNITGISPPSGGIAGGTNVTLRGTNFTGATLVTFGGLSATALNVVNSTTITCITPVRSAGAVGIIVATGGGPSTTFSSFTYVTPPSITDISPLSGSTEGGTNVTITGTNFAGATSVTFDGLAATSLNVVNSTTITCITPAHTTGVGGIIVTTPGGSSSEVLSFTYITPPNITEISSLSGSTTGGTNMTIRGTNFTGATSVTFGGLSATSISIVDSTTITCVTPARTTAGAVGIIVTTGGGPSGAFSSFTYITPPVISSISQLTGSTAGGTNVTITGTNFTGATSVTFDGLAATSLNVVNNTTITCITPARTSAGAVGVIVTTGGGPSGAFSSFTYITPPVISSISPPTGSIVGGTSVTITGTNFTGATSVTFDGLSATSLNVVNSTTITCITPAHSDGAVDVIVTTGGGPSAVFSSFTYIIPSSITDISPLSGPNIGGTSVTITGTNFTGATAVTFGGIAATSLNIVDSTTITCITPAVSSDGAVGVVVTTGGGPSASFSSFTYSTSPVISSISPSSGGIAGGASVTITGINFTGATSVTFDGIAATTINVVNSTTITCITPARTSAGAVGIVVSTAGGSSAEFSSYTYITPPVISSILSASGSTAGGNTVTITGTHFTGATSVTFDGIAATSLNVVNSTTITCVTPARTTAGAVGIIVTTVGGTSDTFSSFTYITPPNITDISSSSGSTLGGNTVTITGTNFTGATSVTFDGLAATSLNVVNSTTITCITPARTSAGTVDVIVTTGGGPSTAYSQFTYITPPNITSISQLTGSTTGGTSVTITGTNFTGATSVTFGGSAATSIDVVNSTTITCITPAHSAGAVNVIVTTIGGPSSAFSSFTYITPPNITAISPLVGSTAGGNSITITGTNFTGETSVTFDGLAATTISVVNSTTITCITPAHINGAVGIIVTSEGRTSTAFSSFTYITPPVITSILPSSGSTLGGTNVTITGTNFTGATSVTFDGLAATSLIVANSTTITCITPAHINGEVGIIVTTGGGPSATFSSFTYNTPPSVTGISQLTGSTAGGTSVTITGTSFTGATSVTFGGVAATSLSIVDSTTITCITPARTTAGAVGVIVITGGGPSNTFSSYTYILPPSIKSIAPASVPRTGGISVTITGTNFIGATSVTLSGLNATSFSVVSNTSITCVTPARTSGGAVNVIVTTGGGPSNTFSTFIYTPYISAILPAFGTRTGGTSVKLTGVGFTGATSVTFGGVPATNVSVFNPTTITCKTGASSIAGEVGVVVTTGDGPSNTFSPYTYLIPPNITSISPTYGGTTGGTIVTIKGKCFTGVSSVLFDTLKVKSLKVIDDTTIICVTAARPIPGEMNITVRNSIGTSNVFPSFTYIMTPKITGISPNFGSTTGGNIVTITGTDLIGATEVMVGDLSASSFTVVDSTTITCVTPARTLPAAVGIIVITGGGPSKKSSNFTYILPPVITSISPSFGGTTGGNVVTITGLNFKGANQVTFGGLNATAIKASPIAITCKTPVALSAGPVDVIVRTGGGPSNTFSSYTFITPPVITDISPPAGNKAGGNNITITGTNLTGATSVAFGKSISTNITVVNDTTLTCITPIGAVGAAGVIVRTGGGPSSIFASFTFVTPASIGTISPLTGSTAGGTLVTIKGKDFAGATSVTIGGVEAISFTIVNPTLITCITPARAAPGAFGIIVTTAGGQSKQFSFYNYLTPPVITGISPAFGGIAGGNIVTLTGTSFTGATSVTFNGKAATPIKVVDSTTITCKVPSSTTAGAASVIVTTGGGPSDTFSDYTYITPAVITSISPVSGTKLGGTSVTITGTNFNGASNILFGAKAATDIIVVNNTTITCVTPASATPIAVAITLTTGGGLSNKFSSFTYN